MSQTTRTFDITIYPHSTHTQTPTNTRVAGHRRHGPTACALAACCRRCLVRSGSGYAHVNHKPKICGCFDDPSSPSNVEKCRTHMCPVLLTAPVPLPRTLPKNRAPTPKTAAHPTIARTTRIVSSYPRIHVRIML